MLITFECCRHDDWIHNLSDVEKTGLAVREQNKFVLIDRMLKFQFKKKSFLTSCFILWQTYT